jgi:hypothetical protein
MVTFENLCRNYKYAVFRLGLKIGTLTLFSFMNAHRLSKGKKKNVSRKESQQFLHAHGQDWTDITMESTKFGFQFESLRHSNIGPGDYCRT